MKNIFSIALIALAVNGTASALENNIPDGFSLKDRISFDYDEESCGQLDFRLDQNDDCTVEFLDFFAASDFEPYRECDLTITVDLPKGLRIAPSLLAIEGEYEVAKEGKVSIQANYGLDYYDKVSIAKTFYGPHHKRVASDAFLLTKSWNRDQLSQCGGKAVFKGKFILGAKRGWDAESEITIDKSEREQLATWGWDYEPCHVKRPKHCSGIAGDPELADVYPECHEW